MPDMHENEHFALTLRYDWSQIFCRRTVHHSAGTTSATVPCGWHRSIRTQPSMDLTIKLLWNLWEAHRKEKHADAPD
jgi:hypothetical protein